MTVSSFPTDAGQLAGASCVTPFYLTGEDEEISTPLIRGRLARLFDPARTILGRHDYQILSVNFVLKQWGWRLVCRPR